MKKVWVVDDEEKIRDLIRRYLENESFTVRTFDSAEALEIALFNDNPDMFILDIMLPGDDGLALCRRIRAGSEAPIIFVSARGEEFDRILGLELGADDYLGKPFSPRELVIRVKTIFKRLAPRDNSQALLELKNVTVDPGQRKVIVDGSEIHLSTMEFDLLHLFATSPGRPFGRAAILDMVWGYEYGGGERAVDDTIKRIRKKFRQAGAETRITSVWGYGYRLDL